MIRGRCGLIGLLTGAQDRNAAGSELAKSAVVIMVCISTTSLPNSATPVSEPGQLPDKQATAEASVDFQPIVVREEQKLSSGLCCDQSVPAEFKRKFDRFG
jgi:hypothetical protein